MLALEFSGQTPQVPKVRAYRVGRTSFCLQPMAEGADSIVEGGSGTAADKIAALTAAGVKVAEHPEQIPDLL